MISKEWIALTTFGEIESSLVVLEISQVQNEHIEVVKEYYPCLLGLWFSDMSKIEETLNTG